MKHWIYLCLASICEIGWFYCIRYLNNLSLEGIVSGEVFESEIGILAFLSITGYIVLGIINVLLFSMALKKIPAAAAFAAWTGLALLGTTLIDGFYLEYDFTIPQGIFMILIVAGILGLRASAKTAQD